MQIEKGIPILDGKLSTNEKYATIAANALKIMTEALVKMETSGYNEKSMMDKCVWPILQEASLRYSAIAKDEDNSDDVPLDGFEYLIG